MRYNWCKFGCEWSIGKVTLREEWSTFSTVSLLLFHGSFWNSTPITHCTSSAIGTSLVAIGQQWRVLYFKNKVFLLCISPSITWIFLKLHTCHSLSLCYNCYKFGCDWSITKCTLLKEQSTFSTVFILFHGSYWNSTPITHCTCTTIDISLVAMSQ